MLAQQTALLHHLRRLIAPRAAEADSDADLMARFIARRDEAAFADLVARHGPMILRLPQRSNGQRLVPGWPPIVRGQTRLT